MEQVKTGFMITFYLRGHYIEIYYTYYPGRPGRMPETAPDPSDLEWTLKVDGRTVRRECLREMVESMIMEDVEHQMAA